MKTFNSFEDLKGVLTNSSNNNKSNNGKNNNKGNVPTSISKREEKKAARSIADLKVVILRPEPTNRMPWHSGGNGATCLYKWFLQYTRKAGWIWKSTKEMRVSFPAGKAPDMFYPSTNSEGELTYYGFHASKISATGGPFVKGFLKKGCLFKKTSPGPVNQFEMEWQIARGGSYPDYDMYRQLGEELTRASNEKSRLESDLREFRQMKNSIYYLKVTNFHPIKHKDNENVIHIDLRPKIGDPLCNIKPENLHIPVEFFKCWFNVPEEEDNQFRISWDIPGKTVAEAEAIKDQVDEKFGDDCDYDDHIPNYDPYWDEWGRDYSQAYYKPEYIRKYVNTQTFWRLISDMKKEIKSLTREINRLKSKRDEISSKWVENDIPVFGLDEWLKASFNGMANSYKVEDLDDWNYSDPNAIVFHPGWNTPGNDWDTEDYLDPNSQEFTCDLYYRKTHNKGIWGEGFRKWQKGCQTFSVIIDSTGKAYKYPPISDLIKVTDSDGKDIPVVLLDIPNAVYEDGVYKLPTKYFITKILNCGYEVSEGKKGSAVITLHRF